MTCNEFQNRLSSYMDGELSRWSRWKVQNHLRYCPDCATLLRDLSEVDSALLLAARESAAPEYLTASVMRRLPAMPPALSSRRALIPWTAGVAMACVQVLALFGAYRWGFVHGIGTGQPGSVGSSLAPFRAHRPGSGTPKAGGAGVSTSPVPAVRPGVLASPARYSDFDPSAYTERVSPGPRSVSKRAPSLPAIRPGVRPVLVHGSR